MARMMPPGPMLPPEQGPNPHLVQKIVQGLKINGIFDEMRKDCLADIDTKPAFLNLKQRVEGHVKGILAGQQWSASLNKNQLRSRIRESVMQSGILNEGVDRILYQVFSAKAYPVFLPKIQDFVKEKGSELKKEFIPPVMMNAPPFGPPPIPEPPEMQPEPFTPPMPAQPPPPESPAVPDPGELSAALDESVQQPPAPDTSEEILTYEDQEFYVKDVAPEDAVTKPINTPSPQHSLPGSTEENAPKIPQDVVNPLKSLIQSLLVSKKTLDSMDVEAKMDSPEEEAKVEGYSPTIDPMQIEAFTDEEDDEIGSTQGPKTPVITEQASTSVEATRSATSSRPRRDSHSPRRSYTYTPPSTYSPLSPGRVYRARDEFAAGNGSDAEESTTPAYDPTKFSYERISDSTPVNEDFQSPPSPLEATDTTERSQYSDDTSCFLLGQRNLDIDSRRKSKMEERYRRSSSSDSSASSSGSGISASVSTSEDENMNEETAALQEEQVIEQEVVEMVEEIEVVEEFVSVESPEEGEKIHSGSDSESNNEEERKIPKAYAEKKKKKKAKKKKAKKQKAKRTRSSSVSSGEITSSGELSTDSSTDSSRPTRPTQPPRPKPVRDSTELEERGRLRRDEGIRDRPYWPNAASSSDYLSSPRMRRPYSPPPPRRPYSPDFHRFEGNRDMGYRPLPDPRFRDRPMFPVDYRPHHSRFSPPPYRRSPPRFNPGPRLDYPRMPFGSPRSPPRRPYSPPPRMMGGFPGDRHMYRHRWVSPPRPGVGHRRPSRSPPPGIRRDDGPGPSRY